MSYVGLGDIIPGAACWFDLSAYNAAYAAPGNNPAIDVLRADNATATINILSSGQLDVATLAAFVGSQTWQITQWYDQTGGGYHLTVPSTTLVAPAGSLTAYKGEPALLLSPGAHASVLGNVSGPNLTLPYSMIATAVRQQFDSDGPEVFSLNGGGFGSLPRGNNGEAIYFGDVANYAFMIGDTTADQINGKLTDGTWASLMAMFNVNGSPSQFWINGLALAGAPTALNTAIYNGSGGTDGTYYNVPLHGGSGTGAMASQVVIAGGGLNSVNLAAPYSLSPPAVDYEVGDVLTMDPADIGGCVGASITLTRVADGVFTDGVNLSPSKLKVGGVNNCHVAIVRCAAWPFDITPYMAAITAFVAP
jgi:hypothetical protein